ncbi:hypothetical protein [Tenacibaculum jejuense]|uniref:Probable lipoprotein n=1 Tax=Tenacibaculum jejuense TaxID=584609 RepID=A0A238UEG8_9FLAO|nr:hypothetical protein [Tenacibaculum jejuense]SNR17597.1 Probable lipoprotein precursor [Tenacibaculum jejuense]
MKQFRTLFLGISLAVFVSCVDSELTPIENEQPNQEQLIFKLDFEEGNENFITHAIGDFPENEPVIDRGQTEDTCGTLFRGQTEDFTEWKGYDFKGNDTNFMGLDMGSCGGFFEAVVKTDFFLEEGLNQGEGKLSFRYYMPGDFTEWENNNYTLNVIIEHANSNNDFSNDPDFIDVLVRFSAEINQDGWVDFSGIIPTSIDAGEYSVIVRIVGSSAAIDDITLVRLVSGEDQDGDQGGSDKGNGGQDGNQGGNDNENGGQDGNQGGNDNGNGGQDGNQGGNDNGNGGQDGNQGGNDNGNGGQDGNQGGNDNGNGGQDGNQGGSDNGNGGQDGNQGGSDNGNGGN